MWANDVEINVVLIIFFCGMGMGANGCIYVHTDDDKIAFRGLIDQVGYLIQIILVFF